MQSQIKIRTRMVSYVCMSNTPGLASNSTVSVTGRPCGVIIKNKIRIPILGRQRIRQRLSSDLALNCRRRRDYSSIPANRSHKQNLYLCPVERWRDGAEDYTCWSCTKKNSAIGPPYLFSTTSIRVPRTTQIKAKYALALRKNLIENITE